MNLFAYTEQTGPYPGYVSINRNEAGDVVVSVRSAPTQRHGSYICGYAHDAGEPGRCTAGDANCNNYCNMAPEKGPMQDHPLPCVQTTEGAFASFTVPASEWGRPPQVVP
jgi:hypothetical protein